MAQSNTELSKQRKTKADEIATYLSSPGAKAQMAKACGSLLDPEKQVRVAMTIIRKTPALAKCSMSSLVESLMTISQMGLKPDGIHAHLVPYKDKCSAIIDYKGLVELAYRSGKVASICCDVVHEGDQKEFLNGNIINHVPWGWLSSLERPDSQGELIGAYATVRLANGGVHQEKMTLEEVQAIKKRSPASGSGPWVTDFNEMAKKTVFRRCSKWIPLGGDVAQAIQTEDQLAAQAQPRAQIVKGAPISSIMDMRNGGKEAPEAQTEPEEPYDGSEPVSRDS